MGYLLAFPIQRVITLIDVCRQRLCLVELSADGMVGEIWFAYSRCAHMVIKSHISMFLIPTKDSKTEQS